MPVHLNSLALLASLNLLPPEIRVDSLRIFPLNVLPPAGPHFIDRHRSALIERVTAVDRVLDYLLEQKVLSAEAYGDVHSQPTRQRKMRSVMDLGNIRHSQRGKDLLCSVLEDVEPFMMDELKEGPRPL